MTPAATTKVTGPAGPASTAARLSADDFAVLFKQSFHSLYVVAVAVTRDAALADDVVQDAAVVALGKLDQFEPGTNFVAWMAQLVRYVAFNSKRKERLRRVSPLDANDMDRRPRQVGFAGAWAKQALGQSTELPDDQTDFDDYVMAGLRSLSDVARTCLLLRTLGEMTYAEIAAILGIPEGTAMSHVHRTRQLLRERVAAFDGGPATGGAPS